MSIDFYGVGGSGTIGDIKRTQNSTKTSGSSASQDTVQFSSLLEDASKATETTSDSSVERAARVAELQEQVADGSYSPDLDKVASSLLQFLVENQ